MPLPESRNTTYTAGDAIKANDLNAIQDAIIGGKHGEKVLQIPAAIGENNAGASWDFGASVAGQANMYATPGSGDAIVFAIPLHVGDRIKAVRARIQDTAGAHTISMRLHKSDSTADLTSGSSQVGATTTSAGDGTRQQLALTGLTETIVTGMFYNVVFTANDATTTTHRIVGVEVTYDRP